MVSGKEEGTEGHAFVPPFLEGHGVFFCDEDLAPTVCI
jgi:hypothetical protein